MQSANVCSKMLHLLCAPDVNYSVYFEIDVNSGMFLLIHRRALPH